MQELNGRFLADKDMLEKQQMIDDCEKRESKLTEWESEFIDSLANRICRGHTLTDKQAERLLKIWDRITG
jgi:hypothetical protein